MKMILIDGKAQPVYSISDLARAVGLDPQTIFHRVRYVRSLPEPPIHYGRRWYYGADLYHEIVRAELARKN